MHIVFRQLVARDADLLVDFLTSQPWPYHAGAADPGRIRRNLAKGFYHGKTTRTFWMVDGETVVGMLRLWDLDTACPLSDLRVSAARRGQGLGTLGMRFMTEYLFAECPGIDRVEGKTRHDNVAMRRALERCGYVLEAQYRRSWPGSDGVLYDTVNYSILRSDWETGVTTPLAGVEAPAPAAA